jgi:hypothetical protein
VVSTVIWISTTIPKVILAGISVTAPTSYELLAVPIKEIQIGGVISTNALTGAHITREVCAEEIAAQILLVFQVKDSLMSLIINLRIIGYVRVVDATTITTTAA